MLLGCGYKILIRYVVAGATPGITDQLIPFSVAIAALCKTEKGADDINATTILSSRRGRPDDDCSGNDIAI